MSRAPPFPIFPVSSSYKNRNCLNIRTSLDILDNKHPRKYPLACVVFNKGWKPEVKLACFLKVTQKLIGSRLSKSRYSTNFQARFVRREKSLVKISAIKFEGKRIVFGASKPKLRRFEIRPCYKMRPFGSISASTFWKIHPDIHICIQAYKRLPCPPILAHHKELNTNLLGGGGG